MSEKLEKIIKWMEDFKLYNRVNGVVLGLSGGKDSTVVAMLAKKVFGDNVVAIMMPNGEQKDISDSIEIAKTLELRYYEVNINHAYTSLLDSIKCGNFCYMTDAGLTYLGPEIEVTAKSKTNIPPRIRMTTLYAIAQSLGYLVIGTGNASEAAIGWTTKFGDNASDFNPIGHLTRREVVEIGLELAKEFGLDKKFIVKSPSDGLTGKSDEDNFGFTYDELDDYLMYGKEGPNIEKIKNMMKWSEHKKKMPPTVE